MIEATCRRGGRPGRCAFLTGVFLVLNASVFGQAITGGPAGGAAQAVPAAAGPTTGANGTASVATNVSPAAASAQPIRLKDIATIEGVRENQLTGFGLVTGLAGKGDTSGSALLERVVDNLVSAFGVQVAEKDIRSRNCAVVMVTATLPAFSHAGDRIAVTVSSIGDATDLTGGVLLQTNLKAANDQVYAVAQGPVAASAAATVKTVADVPDGALVERATTPSFVVGGKVDIILRNPDFITANAAVSAIRAAVPNVQADATDPSMIQVAVPQNRSSDPVAFIAQLEQVTLVPDASDTVVVNPRSGVVVVGRDVKIGKVAVSYKDTQITVGDITSPYYGLSDNSSKNPFVLGETTTVEDLVSVLKDAGVNTQSIIEILKAIERAGALYGRLVVM